MDLIKKGQRSPAVEDMQARLERLGYSVPESERGGFFGPGTEAAVRTLQQQRGLNVDGLVGRATWRELIGSTWALGDRLLALTDPPLAGDDVRDLQARLNALGFAAGKHDGIFGIATVGALRDFQRNLAINEDGIMGLETVKALDRLRLVIRPGLGPRTREREARRGSPPGLAGKRIAIDPGHGGDDPGELGPSGETEQEIAFQLAARTATFLENQGAETMLTRGPNDGPEDSERALLANSFEAHLLVSLHLNHHRLGVAEGAATYFFAHEGVASEPGEHLASLVLESLSELGRNDCRAHGMSYPLLRETRMPAIVVEPGFISNPEEVKFLTDAPSIDQVALAVVKALDRYFSEPPD